MDFATATAIAATAAATATATATAATAATAAMALFLLPGISHMSVRDERVPLRTSAHLVHEQLDLIVPGPHLVKIGLLMLTCPGQQVQHVQIQVGMLRAAARLSEREDMGASLGDSAGRAFDFQHQADTLLWPLLSQTVDG